MLGFLILRFKSAVLFEHGYSLADGILTVVKDEAGKRKPMRWSLSFARAG